MTILTDLRGTGHGIRCPRHYMLKPGGQPFVMVLNPLLRKVSEANAKALGISRWVKQKDAFGRPIQNFKDYIQPVISANFAKEQIYKKDNPICISCRRCLLK